MALMRCKDHEPDGHKHIYAGSKEPVGYPKNTALICGRKNCNDPALIWLEDNQLKDYNKGERIFQPQSFVTKVRAQ